MEVYGRMCSQVFQARTLPILILQGYLRKLVIDTVIVKWFG